MKTTIDIADPILIRIKEIARQENTTIKELTEEGLSIVLERHNLQNTYTSRPVTYGGNGLSPRFELGGWAAIREEIYGGDSQS